MGLFWSFIFLIPLVVLSCWWWFFFSLILLFGVFVSSFWFVGFFNMMSYSFGGDLLSMGMIFLTIWVTVLMVLASLDVLKSSCFVEFLFILLLLLLVLVMSFSTINLFMFYLLFESSLFFTFILVLGWGRQSERVLAGFYLLFYTLFVSFPLLVVIFVIEYYSFTLFYFLICIDMGLYGYLLVVLTFMVSVPMPFVHFWLPRAHVEAPVSGSMILAGVLLKVGWYGLLRSFLFIGNVSWGFFWVGLSLFGGVLLGIVCLYQVDVSALIAYSSIVHMSGVLAGVFTYSSTGFCGSLMFVIGHGFCSSGLFCLMNIIYERTSSRSVFVNSGLVVLSPSLSFFWFMLLSGNMSAPLTLNLLGEVSMLCGVIGWSVIGAYVMGVLFFLNCCYNVYLYLCVSHGGYYEGLSGFCVCSVREYLLIFFHLFPLNIIFLSLDLFALWI